MIPPSHPHEGQTVKALIMDLLRAPETINSATLADLADSDWGKMEEIARQHRILPALDHAMSRVTKAARPACFATARRNWTQRMLRVGAECAAIHHLFEKAGIKHAFLKGVPLAFGAYQEVGLRPVRDIDVLVPEDQLDHAFDVLRQAGGLIERYSHKAAEVSVDGKHMPPVWSPGRFIPVELHSNLLAPDVRLRQGLGQALETKLWAGLETVMLARAALPVPAPDVLFAHLVIHAFYDHELNNGPLIVTDLMALIDSGRPAQDVLADTIAELGIEAAANMALSLLPSGYLKDMPPDLKTRETPPGWSDEIASCLLLQDMSQSTEASLVADISALSLPARLRLIMGRVFATRETMLTRWAMTFGSPKGAPRLTPVLWLWFVGLRCWQMGPWRRKTVGPQSVHSSLLALRATLETSSKNGPAC